MQNVNFKERLKTRFAEDGGKVFFADASKVSAFSAVGELLSAENPDSTLCIVKNSTVAKQARTAIFADKSATLILNSASFDMLLDGFSKDREKSSEYAKLFKEKYPNLIITLDSAGDAVLHKVLTRMRGKAGEYNEGHAMYAVSDFLTDAGYSFVIVDDVYSMFDFKAVPSESCEEMKPKSFERIDLLGVSYFVDTGHSYKKLSRIVDSSDKAVIISDTLVDKDIITFYAGLSLIKNSFSYKEAKKFAAAHAFDLTSEIDTVCGSISYCNTDSGILSRCLNKAMGSRQIIPSDLDSLAGYFMGNLNHMTQEEVFLRVIYTQAKKRFSMKVSHNEDIIRTLDDDDNLAMAICDVFFDDELKGDIESELRNLHIAKMGEDEYRSIIKLFEKYALISELPEIGERCNLFRIYHDDSAFEDLLRRENPGFDRDEESFSASYKGDDMIYKCVATKRLIESGKAKLPVLIVSLDKKERICSELSKILDKNVEIFRDDMSVCDAETVTVMSYEELRSVANCLNIGSAVFFDVLPDINLFDSLVKCALGLGKESNVTVLVTYDNISGPLADSWQDTWRSDKLKIVPIRNTEVYIKGDSALDYNVVVNRIDTLFESYKQLIEGSYRANISDLAKDFSDVVSDFSLDVSVDRSVIETDFGYFKDIAGHYANVFANSVSVGSNGREVYFETRGELKGKKRSKGELTPYTPVKENNKVIFNICACQLHEGCDYKHLDCDICEKGAVSNVNDFELFCESVRRFFKETVKIMTRIEDELRKKLAGETINPSGGNAVTVGVSLSDIRDAQKSANDILTGLIKNSPGKGITYYVDYSDIFDIREAVQSIYYKLFVKYYNQIMKIFDKATNKMKTAFETAAQGVNHSEDTL